MFSDFSIAEKTFSWIIWVVQKALSFQNLQTFSMTTDLYPSTIKPFKFPPPPQKKHNFKAPNLFRTFTFLSLTFFLVHCTKNNQTNKPTTPPQGTPSTIAKHAGFSRLHRHTSSRWPWHVCHICYPGIFKATIKKKPWVFTKKTIFWIKKFESSKIGHYYCNSLWLPECLVILNIKIYQAYEHYWHVFGVGGLAYLE